MSENIKWVIGIILTISTIVYATGRKDANNERDATEITKAVHNLEIKIDTLSDKIDNLQTGHSRLTGSITSLSENLVEIHSDMEDLKNNYIKYLMTGQKDILELIQKQKKEYPVSINIEKINK